MIFNIHAGHNPDGKKGCGAVGIVRESTEARKIKDEVIRQLRLLGHTVFDCTEDNGANQSDVLCKIVRKCNQHKVDVDVSIHLNYGACDKFGNKKTTGAEVLLYNDTSKAKPYAERVCKEISELGYKNRGIKCNKNLYVLRKTFSSAMLIECFFVDDKDDVELYDYKSMASAIVKGLTGQTVLENPVTDTSDVDSKKEKSETATGNTDCIYRVQVGAYKNKENAISLRNNLKKAGFDAAIVKG